MRRPALIFLLVGLGSLVALAQPISETRSGQGLTDIARLAIYLNGTPTSPTTLGVSDGGVAAFAQTWKVVKFQCDNPVAWSVYDSPVVGVTDGGVTAETIAALDSRIVVLPDRDAGLFFRPTDGGATCTRWLMK